MQNMERFVAETLYFGIVPLDFLIYEIDDATQKEINEFILLHDVKDPDVIGDFWNGCKNLGYS